MDAYDVVLKPIISEKSMELMGENKYSFRVNLKANKIQIRKAIEEIFKVNVVTVRTIRMTGKKKRMGANIGKRSDWKKAIVQIVPGQQIKFFEGM